MTVLAELKRASCTADIFFSNRKETLFYAVVEFVLSHPKLFYAPLGVNQNYRNMMLKIQGGNTCLEQVQAAIEEIVHI